MMWSDSFKVSKRPSRRNLGTVPQFNDAIFFIFIVVREARANVLNLIPFSCVGVLGGIEVLVAAVDAGDDSILCRVVAEMWAWLGVEV